jgi:hypothetical protein
MVICPQCGKECAYTITCIVHKTDECPNCRDKCMKHSLNTAIFTIVSMTDGKYVTFKGDGTELARGYKDLNLIKADIEKRKCVKSA